MPPGVVVLTPSLADGFADAGATVAPIADVDDVDAAIAALRGDGVHGVYVAGAGPTAHAAFLQAAREDVAGVVGIDGRSPLDEAWAGALRAPVVALYSEDAVAEAQAFAEALGKAGVLQETVVYDGVRAGFFERGDPPEAVADAWRVALRFIGLGAG